MNPVMNRYPTRQRGSLRSVTAAARRMERFQDRLELPADLRPATRDLLAAALAEMDRAKRELGRTKTFCLGLAVWLYGRFPRLRGRHWAEEQRRVEADLRHGRPVK